MYAFSSPQTCHMPRPFYPHCFDYLNNIWWGIQCLVFSIWCIIENTIRWVSLLHYYYKVWQGTHVHIHIVVHTCIRACMYVYIYAPPWRYDPTWAMASSFLGFLDHTQRRTADCRTPLNEWSARRRDLYLKTHNTHNRQTSMPPAGFEPTIPASERP
jgi:hypothetical protein